MSLFFFQCHVTFLINSYSYNFMLINNNNIMKFFKFFLIKYHIILYKIHDVVQTKIK